MTPTTISSKKTSAIIPELNTATPSVSSPPKTSSAACNLPAHHLATAPCCNLNLATTATHPNTMSIVLQTMFSDQFNPAFNRDAHHTKAASFNGLFGQFKSVPPRKMRSVSPASFQSSTSGLRKRSHDQSFTSLPDLAAAAPQVKRSRTAPLTPPYSMAHSPPPLSSPPAHAPENITLPSFNVAMAEITRQNPARVSHRSTAPTVSLDYFDTYKPNDENWRFGLLDSIRNSKLQFDSSSYSYLEKHASKKLPSFQELESRPRFDTRMSSKALPSIAERKINFPYESNYTYLNKTYMNDVERYPEYLELAQSLVLLSGPPSKPAYVPTHEEYTRSSDRLLYSPSHDCCDHKHAHPSPPSPQFASVRYDNKHQSPILRSPSQSRLPGISHLAYASPDHNFEYRRTSPIPKKEHKPATQHTRFIPITPPSVKDKSRLDLMKSPPRSSASIPRVCISCGSDQSPCWRPSWSIKEGQLCNSCGLRYKKTSARCTNSDCKKIPAKGEWSLMQSKGKVTFEDGEHAYGCLDCGSKVDVRK